MADRTKTMWKKKDGILFRCEFGEVTVSLSDTVTFDNFNATSNLVEAYFFKQTDGTEMTVTHAAANVVTVSGAGTNIRCIYVVYGYREDE